MKEKTCPKCFGAGTEQDLGMSVAMGVALGGGYMPMTRICTVCWGSGRVEDK